MLFVALRSPRRNSYQPYLSDPWSKLAIHGRPCEVKSAVAGQVRGDEKFTYAAGTSHFKVVVNQMPLTRLEADVISPRAGGIRNAQEMRSGAEPAIAQRDRHIVVRP